MGVKQAPDKAKPGRKPLAEGFDRPNLKWGTEQKAILGTMTDAAAAEKLGVSTAVIVSARRRFSVPAFDKSRSSQRAWGSVDVSLLGTMGDAQLSEKLGRSIKSVVEARWRHNIPSFGAVDDARRVGRPALPPGEKLIPVPVRLSPAQRDKLQRIGPQRLRDWLDRVKE